MKRAILLMLLLVGAAIFVPAQTQAAITIPANLVVQFDPAGDVFQLSEEGAENIVTGRGEIDILSIEVEELPASTIPPQPAKLKLTMTLKSAPLVNPEVSYIFLVSTPATTYAIMCNYSDIKMTFAPFILNLEAGEPVASPLSTATTTGNQAIAEIVQTALGNPASITSFRAVTVDNRNEDYKYGDMAPDKLVKVTSPSEKTTIWQPTTGNYVFSGICSKSQLDFTSVEASINNGASWHAASTTDGWKTWSITFSVASLSGQNKIMVRATDTGAQVFTDELTFFVNNEYQTETNRPKIPDALADMVVGTVYTYETEGNPGISGIELSSTTHMTMEVQKKETVINPDRTYETLKLHTSQSGSAVIGIFSISQSVERDSWRPIDNQQTIVKEYTVTSQSIEKDGSPLNSAWSFTNATYESPGMDPGFLGKMVGEWWESSATGTQDTKAVDAEGQVTTRESTSTKSVFNELLYSGSVSPGNAEGQVPALT
ncbi:MAG: hypothetical protein QCI38_05480, partial [Candidatus Thermoplasmatota archaeon]|nr:hypothetical protein [Candidatus Thermoplasmatota archaeon]